MKLKSFGILILLLAGLLFTQKSEKITAEYKRQSDVILKQEAGANGAAEWLRERKANQSSGTIDPQDVFNAREQVQDLARSKNNSNLVINWNELGPNNIGGRTRAILFDKENPNIMFAGGVSGGLWKSTTAGHSWEKVLSEDGVFENLAVASICQASNGDIYFGTGEGMYSPWGGGTGGINGTGIWKSTNGGESFFHIESTWNDNDSKFNFVQVNKMGADPVDPNRIYAACRGGLMVTEDGGETWYNLIPENPSPASDVKVATDGAVVAAVGRQAYISPNGQLGSFVNKSENNGSKMGLINKNGVGRLEFAFSPSNPDYVYCCAANTAGEMENVYQSQDQGRTWHVIGPGGSELFQPFRNQGWYDNTIAVFPDNPGKIMIGGIDLWTWAYEENWEHITLWNAHRASPLFVHADNHTIVFHPTKHNIIFIGNDGGIFRSLDGGDSFHPMNKNYNVTQFYSVAFSGRGEVLGGTQDNGSLYIDFHGNTPQAATTITGGDGGYCAISQMSPNTLFTTYINGLLYRTDLNDVTRTLYESGTGGAFVTPIALYENWNDTLSWDSIWFKAYRDYEAGEVITGQSLTNQLPIKHVLEKPMYRGDSLKLQDHYGSMLALGIGGKAGIKVSRGALNYLVTRRPFYSIINRDLLDDEDQIETMEFAQDGDNVFVVVRKRNLGKFYLYHCGNLLKARDRRSTDATTAPFTFVVTNNLIGVFDRIITSIAVDPKNPDNVMLTLGNYGNTNYVYYTDKATKATSPEGTFKPKQGNLPKLPAYASLLIYPDTKMAMVGTDMGLYATKDITADQPVWIDQNRNGMDYVPVFMIEQQLMENSQERRISNNGHIYIGTHGRGIFSSNTFAGPKSTKNKLINDFKPAEIEVYPNPAVFYANIKFDLKTSGNVEYKLFDMQGKLVRHFMEKNIPAGEHQFELPLQNVQAGNYIVKVGTPNQSGSIKLIKQ